jgi:hypothetical protein
MKLVSEGEFNKFIEFKSHPLPPTLEQKQFLDTEDQGSGLLNLKNLPDDIKVALYNSFVRDTYKKLRDLKNDKVEKVESKEDTNSKRDTTLSDSDKSLLEFLPETYRAAGSKIIQSLRGSPSLISWESSGTCSFYGKPQTDTNIVDLLSYVLRPHLKSQVPNGANRFLYILKLLNVPSSILGHRLRRTIAKRTLEELRQNQRRSGIFPGNLHSDFRETLVSIPEEANDRTSEDQPGPSWLDYIPWRGGSARTAGI